MKMLAYVLLFQARKKRRVDNEDLVIASMMRNLTHTKHDS
jgi:hypothetical protein